MQESSQVLAEILNRQRDALNARFALARSRKRSLSPSEWREVLREDVAPVILAVQGAQHADSVVDSVAVAAYETALELLSREQIGPRADGIVAELWRGAMPLVANVVAASPRRTLVRATNALLEMKAHNRAEIWAERLRDLAAAGAFATCTPEEFERAILALAWRCGLAHARQSALKYLRAMPFELARAILDAPQVLEHDWPLVLERLEREPFFDLSRPDGEQNSLRCVAELGEWAGWGGAMDEPPRVVRRRGALWAWSGRSWWRLHADAFGATLTRARFGAEPAGALQKNESCGAWKLAPQKAPSEALVVSRGPNALYAQPERVELKGFGGVLSAASDDSLLAFTTPLSMRIFVVARADAASST